MSYGEVLNAATVVMLFAFGVLSLVMFLISGFGMAAGRVSRLRGVQAGQFEREMEFRMRGASVLGKTWEAQQASDGR